MVMHGAGKSAAAGNSDDTSRGAPRQSSPAPPDYDSWGSVSVRHIVDERGCSVMLREPDCGGNGRNSA